MNLAFFKIWTSPLSIFKDIRTSVQRKIYMPCLLMQDNTFEVWRSDEHTDDEGMIPKCLHSYTRNITKCRAGNITEPGQTEWMSVWNDLILVTKQFYNHCAQCYNWWIKFLLRQGDSFQTMINMNAHKMHTIKLS